MKDRVVEFPNRYRMIPVSGQENVVDLVPEPGVVTEPGTELNKANLLSDETRDNYGLSVENANVDAALGTLIPYNGRYAHLTAGSFVDTATDIRFSTLVADTLDCASLDGDGYYKLTIPKLVSAVRLCSVLKFSYRMRGSAQISAVKNGVVDRHMGRMTTDASSGNTTYDLWLPCASEIMPVSAGDTLAVRVTSGSFVPDYLIMEVVK